MSTPLASLGSLVHPHQMEVQEFDFYALVIDARSAMAYQEDHLPGAVNIPVQSDQQGDGRRVGAAPGRAGSASEVASAMPDALASQVMQLSAGDAVLIYCDCGGLDSMVWATPLKAAGFRVDVLGGGWVNYRRWVTAGLEVLPRALTFRPLLAPPVGGLCCVLDRLIQLGEQVIDLAALAGQKTVPGLTLSGDVTPSQSAFETALIEFLRSCDPQRPVWVGYRLTGLAALDLPPSLVDALRRSTAVLLEVPVDVRAQAWCDRLRAVSADLPGLLLEISTSAKTACALDKGRLQALVSSGLAVAAMADVIKHAIEQSSQVDRWAGKLEVAKSPSLQADGIAELVGELMG